MISNVRQVPIPPSSGRRSLPSFVLESTNGTATHEKGAQRRAEAGSPPATVFRALGQTAD